MKNADIHELTTMPDGISVGVSPGTKSKNDFRVHFRRGEKGVGWRSPTHVHLIVDMYTKRMGNPWLTSRFVDYMLDELIAKAQTAQTYPPAAPALDQQMVDRFTPLNSFGEYRIEFIILVQGLITQGEKTNYPTGTLQRQLWSAFRRGDEIYSVLSIALRRL